ncbi:MAG: hypothetical protein IJU20_05385 [Clostridia bacterium]|nr:hypothetical protein [Clostridia bacterium]
MGNLVASLIILVFAVIIILVHLIRGLRKGLGHTLGSLLMLLGALTVSIIATKVIMNVFGGMLVQAFRTFLPEAYEQMKSAVPASTDAVPALLKMILGPLVFLNLFAVCSIIFHCLGSMIRTLTEDIASKMEKENKLTWLAGIIGGLCGFLLVISIFSVFAGYGLSGSYVMDGAYVLTEAVQKQEQSREAETGTQMDLLRVENEQLAGLLDTVQSLESGDVASKLVRGISQILGNTSNKALYYMGGGLIFNWTSEAEYEGKTIRLMDESKALGALASSFAFVSELDTTNIKPGQLDPLRDVITTIGKSAILPSLVGSVVAESCTRWSQGEEYMGIASPDVTSSVMQPSIDSLIRIMAATTTETIIEDLSSAVDVIIILVDHHIFEDTKNITNILSNMGAEGLLDQIFDVLEANARLTSLIGEFERIALRVLSSAFGIPENSAQIYDELLTHLCDTWSVLSGNYDDRILSLADEISKSFPDYGLIVTDAQALTLATSLTLAFRGQNGISVPELKAFFYEFASENEESTSLDAGGFEYLTESGKENPYRFATDWMERMSRTLSEQNRDRAAGLILEAGIHLGGAQLVRTTERLMQIMDKDADSEMMVRLLNLGQEEKFRTEWVSLEQIEHGQEEVEQQKTFTRFLIVEGKKLVDEINAMEEESGSDMELRPLLTMFGRMIDNLAASGYNRVPQFLKGLLQSDEFKATLDLNRLATASFADKVTTSVANTPGATYEETLVSLYDVIHAVMTVNDLSAAEDKEDAVRSMLENLTPTTATILSGVVDDTVLESMGVPQDSLAGTSEVMQNLITNLAQMKEEKSDEEAAEEAGAVSDLLTMVMSSSDTDGILFDEGGSTGKSAEEFLESLTNSEVVSSTISESVKGSDDGELRHDPMNISDLMLEQDKDSLKTAIGNSDMDEGRKAELIAFFGLENPGETEQKVQN